MKRASRRSPAQDTDRAMNFYQNLKDAAFIGPMWHILGLAQMISTDIERIVRPLGLSSADLVLLGTIRIASPEVLRATDLAAKLHVSSAALSTRVARLTRKKLLTQWRRDDDRRSTELTITAAGVELSDQATRAVADAAAFSRRFGQLSLGERESLADVLAKLHNLVDRDFLPASR
jgi:DNA-binding MarR family transcriptional regulator